MNPRRRVQHKAEDTLALMALTGGNLIGQGIVNVVTQFGADPTGVSDSTAAFQKAVNAAQGFTSGESGIFSGCTVFIPQGSYLISGTINVPSSDGLTITGVGGATILFWQNAAGYIAGQSMFNFSGAHRPHMSNLVIEANTSLAIGIQLSFGAPGDEWITTFGLFENIYFTVGASGKNLIEQCVVIGGKGADANNDFHHFINVRGELYQKDFCAIVDTQCYLIKFTNCVAQGLLYTSASGAITSSGTTLTTAANLFGAKDVGKIIEVAGAGATGSVLYATIGAIIDSTHITVSPAASTTVGPTATITYGSQCGVRGTTGSWIFDGGSVSSHLYSDYYVGGSSGGAIIIDGPSSEGSRALLQTGGPASGVVKLVTIREMRFSGDGVQIQQPLTINWEIGGSLVIDHCAIGDINLSSPYPIQLSYIYELFGSPYASNVIRDTFISTSQTTLFPGAIPEIEGVCRLSGSGGVPTLLGRQPNDLATHGTSSGTVNLSWGGGLTIQNTISGDSTFVFTNIYSGLGTVNRLVLKYTGNATLTWPGAVNWGGPGAPAPATSGQTDIYQFYNDGTHIYGILIFRG